MLNPFVRKHLQPPDPMPEPPTSDKTSKRRGRKRIDYPAIQTPTMIDIARAAQFFEDEGHVTVRHNQLTVIIGQNERALLDWCVSRFSGRVYGPYTNAAGNDSHTQVIVRERALGFMFTIFSYLTKSRREQFKNALAGQPRARSYQKTISEEGISQAYLERKLANLNKSKNRLVKGSMRLFGVKR